MQADSSTQMVTSLPQEEDAVSTMIRLSQRAFEENLDSLLSKHRGKWAAYHGSEFIGIAATETELYSRCLKLGLHRNEFVVRGIEPLANDEETTFGYSS